MKFFSWLVLFLLIVFGLAVFGNMLRCMTARGSQCPAWCATKEVKCLTSFCEEQAGCQAPSWPTYLKLTQTWFSEVTKK